MLKLLIIAILVGYSFQASALNEHELKDLNEVKQLLKNNYSFNIDNLSWSSINFHCRNITQKTNKVDFNKCRYKSAINYINYEKDSQSCTAQSEDKYPESLLTGSSNQPNKSPGFFGIKKNNYSKVGIHSISSLKNDRKRFFQNCMTKYGWDDPDNWQQGHKAN
jgi:hypothetical protein